MQPAVSRALQDAGGLRLNFIRDVLPAQMTGGWQDGDERYEWLTGSRWVASAHDRAVVDGEPVATGVVAVADSWCSNPANGRGASIGMLHAVTLRDQLRAVGLDDPAAFAEAFHDAAVQRDPECARASLDIRLVLRTPQEVFAEPGLRDKTLRLGSGWREAAPFGPTVSSCSRWFRKGGPHGTGCCRRSRDRV